MDKVKYTSSGIIRNADKLRVGIISIQRLVDWAVDKILSQGINLNFEEYVAELASQGITESDTPDEYYSHVDGYESDSATYLFGDAWIKNADGTYSIDKTKGEFAAVYSSYSENITVEYSKHTTKCHYTSPCYVMADGSGPCGDLDTPGDAVTAYTLPKEYFVENEE